MALGIACAGSGFKVSCKQKPGEGVLTLTWYMSKCLPFGVLFKKFAIGFSWFSSEIKESKLHKFGVCLTKYGEGTQLEQNLLLFFQK